MTQFIIFGAPCTGKTTLVKRLQTAGITVCDMDVLMFTNDRDTFEQSEYNIDEWVKDNPDRYVALAEEWDSMVLKNDGAMVWPRWLEYFPVTYDIAFGLIRDNDEWMECLKKERQQDLLDRMPERDTGSWLDHASGPITSEIVEGDADTIFDLICAEFADQYEQKENNESASS